jgi:hypothetical protein
MRSLVAIVGLFVVTAAAACGCTFNLGKAPPDPSSVVIQFNGDNGLRAPHDTTHANGWDYTSTSYTTIQLYGSWCDHVTNGTYISAVVVTGCPGGPFH